MAIHIAEPGRPVGTRLPEALRARRVQGTDETDAIRRTASNTEQPEEPARFQGKPEVRRALQEYQEESSGEGDAESPYLPSSRLASQALHTISAKAPLRMALDAMAQHLVHHLVVTTDAGEVAGLIDETWVLRQVRQGMDDNAPLSGCELPSFITVTPETDAHHLAQQMLSHELSAALVINHNNQPAGIVTGTDFLRLYADGHHLHTTI
ncbi:CBS domain-containing protein [uncultured Halovibrio sp.]|uniref:CBS domain-containing protein n=1 Tax=uncultured Halovibrio sp. TaxID=985049 RepID=UPI0025DDF4D3|nr:CBS domain-containing protein [uncultured Halovibrio sp.]